MADDVYKLFSKSKRTKETMFRADSNAAQVESALQLSEQSIRDQNATLEVLLLRCWNLRKIPRAHDQLRESNAAYTEIRILPSCSSTVTHESITSLFCE